MIPYLTEWLRSLSSQLEALRVFDYLSSRSILA